MKSKLTVNRLAIGNLKARKRQYAIMIIGIILAMIFSSSIIFFMVSSSETKKIETQNKFGCQDMIVSAKDFTQEDYEQMKEDKMITSYGLACSIGFAYTDKQNNGGTVCFLDDEAKKISNQIFIEGSYPSAENEIAIEKRQLVNFGCAKAKIGDTIKLKLKIQNGLEYLDEVEKEYKIVGILSDKKSNIEMNFGRQNDIFSIPPSIFVSQNTGVEAGGKEQLIAYANIDRAYLREYAKLLHEQNPEYYYNSSSIISEYLIEKCDEDYTICWAHAQNKNDFLSFDSLIDGGIYYIIIIFVLAFASCVAIINAFNSNLKERKRQIGFLRAVGTTKRQIINIFGREAFIISLIATPISTAISYVLVKVILSIISENAVMSKSIAVLIVAAVINVVIVMLAALIPLFSATKITPIQAIRNIDNSRILKKKKIKTVKQFNAARLIARRDLVFYKGSKIAVCIILIVSILFTCFSGSFISYSKQNLRSLPADYTIADDSSYMGSNDYMFFNLTGNHGFSQSQLNEIASKPYAAEVSGRKTIRTNIAVDEYSPYLCIFKADEIAYKNRDSQFENAEAFSQAYEENVRSKVFFDDEYLQNKNLLNVDKELYTLDMYAYEDDKLLKLNGHLVDGKIDTDKLASGEEIILVAPQRVELRVKFKNNSSAVFTDCDKECEVKRLDMTTVAVEECPYKVGDEIDLVTAQTGNFQFDDEDISATIGNVKQTDRKVKIGAIVSTDETDGQSGFYQYGLTILTSIDGINSFADGVPYDQIELNSAYELDEETDKEICDDLLHYTSEPFLQSNYEYTTWQKEEITSMLIAVISIVIIAFAVCASIINNSITARIRESKRAIGTMRAVGAPAGELIKLYILQILSMLGTGTCIGYGIFAAAFFIIIRINPKSEFIFNPWASIIMSCVLFIACAVNVYARIKKEMKNSIVDNIREL